MYVLFLSYQSDMLTVKKKWAIRKDKMDMIFDPVISTSMKYSLLLTKYVLDVHYSTACDSEELETT